MTPRTEPDEQMPTAFLHFIGKTAFGIDRDVDLSLAFDEPEQGIDNLISQLQQKFEVKYNTGLDLVTIRYYNTDSVAQISEGKKIYIEQKSRRTARMLLK